MIPISETYKENFFKKMVLTPMDKNKQGIHGIANKGFFRPSFFQIREKRDFGFSNRINFRNLERQALGCSGFQTADLKSADRNPHHP